MRFIPLLFAPTFLAAQEAAPAVALPEGTPLWVQIVVPLATLIITTVLVPWLRRKTEAAASEGRSGLVEEVKVEALLLVTNLAEQKLPQIAKMVADGTLKDAANVKGVLKALGQEALAGVKDHFKARGVDVVAKLGESTVETIIRWAADKVNPFPGKETAVALVEGGAQKLLEVGLRNLQDKTE